jgi:hypothetical protein
MQIKSAKAKGRRLQNWVRDELFLALGISFDDITTAIMGESGVDVKLTKDKRYLFDFKIECKSQKDGFSAVYKAYNQCKNHSGKGEPLVIIRQDRHRPLAVLDAKFFIKEYRR